MATWIDSSQPSFFFYSQEAGAHPITGIFVLVLAVIQPIMAVFRPHPGEEKYVWRVFFSFFSLMYPQCSCSLLLVLLFFRRYIFNWAHRGVGLSALILAGKESFESISL